MKLNNKGFAVSTVMYMILVVAVILITVTLSLLSSRRVILDKLKNDTLDDIYNTFNMSYVQVLENLKLKAIAYAEENGIQKDSFKIVDLNEDIDDKIIEGYNLSNKYLTVNFKDGSYEVYLGKEETVTDN